MSSPTMEEQAVQQAKSFHRRPKKVAEWFRRHKKNAAVLAISTALVVGSAVYMMTKKRKDVERLVQTLLSSIGMGGSSGTPTENDKELDRLVQEIVIFTKNGQQRHTPTMPVNNVIVAYLLTTLKPASSLYKSLKLLVGQIRGSFMGTQEAENDLYNDANKFFSKPDRNAGHKLLQKVRQYLVNHYKVSSDGAVKQLERLTRKVLSKLDEIK